MSTLEHGFSPMCCEGRGSSPTPCPPGSQTPPGPCPALCPPACFLQSFLIRTKPLLHETAPTNPLLRFLSSRKYFISFYFIYLFFVFLSFVVVVAISWAAPAAYGGSQARGRIRAVATSLRQSHSNAGSEPRLQPTPQLTATPDR